MAWCFLRTLHFCLGTLWRWQHRRLIHSFEVGFWLCPRHRYLFKRGAFPWTGYSRCLGNYHRGIRWLRGVHFQITIEKAYLSGDCAPLYIAVDLALRWRNIAVWGKVVKKVSTWPSSKHCIPYDDIYGIGKHLCMPYGLRHPLMPRGAPIMPLALFKCRGRVYTTSY